MTEELLKEVFTEIDEIPDEVCCVCGHSLRSHVDEDSVWRCHSLGQDFYQCECALRKDRAVLMRPEDPVSYYDLKRRIKKQVEEAEGDGG